MTNQERSFSEQSGIPLRISQTTGRLRREELPWLKTFTAKQDGGVVEKSIRPALAEIPQQADEQDSIRQPSAGNDRFLPQGTAVPDVPRDIPRDVPRYMHGQEPPRKFGPDAVKPETGEGGRIETATSGAFLRQGMPKTLPPIPDASEPIDVPQAIIAAAPEGTAAATRRPTPSQVFVQRLIEIKALSPMQSQPPPPQAGQKSEAGPPSPVAPSFSAVQLVEVPMAYGGQTSASPWLQINNESTSPADFDGQALSQSTEPSAQMGLLDMVIRREESWHSASAESLRFIRTPQQAILERLNQHSAREQQEASPKRVHIGNVHITVQRPGPLPQAQAPSIPPEREREAAAPIFINPWDRHDSLLY